MTENEFLTQVIELSHLLRWRVAHFRGVPILRKNGTVRYQTPVQADGAGFPDLVLVNREKKRVIYAELKSDKGCIRPEQNRWLDDLSAAGQEVYLWRPKDSDDIIKILQTEYTQAEYPPKPAMTTPAPIRRAG